jgi:hypothetical protein
MIIKPQFDAAYMFSEGLAPIKLNNKWGFVNKEGKAVIAPQFDHVDTFTPISKTHRSLMI